MPDIRPVDVNMGNFLDIEQQINQHISYPIARKNEANQFKYRIGDTVVVKKVARQELFGNKASLVGYGTDREFKITARSFRPTGREGAKYLPFYQLDSDLWIVESRLALLDLTPPAV